MNADIIIYALIALFLGWRLFSALGQRGEGDAPPREKSGEEKDMLALPFTPQTPEPAPSPLSAFDEPAPASLAGGLHALRKAEPSFDEKSFLKGARVAFEMIVQAYAAGERAALRPLLSPALFDAFSSGIAARKSAGEKLDLRLLKVIDAQITATRVEGRFGFVTVEFASDQVKETLPVNVVSAPVGGKPPAKPERVTDIWVFRRELGAADPNWMLVETRTD